MSLCQCLSRVEEGTKTAFLQLVFFHLVQIFRFPHDTSYLFMIYLMHPIAQSFVTAPSWFGGGGGQLTPQGTAQNLHISPCSTVQVHIEHAPLLYRKGNWSESERLKVKAQAVSPNRKWVRQTAQILLSTPSFTSTFSAAQQGALFDQYHLHH